ncbi:MAG TPA: M43 family zinc metalloprotease [Bacteroidia bacterium]|jgi:hypothetical protein|nr:M43 family zinc metalloprotease [Bacteroidia bacterium]
MKKNIQIILLSMFVGSSAIFAQVQNMVMPCATYNAMEAEFLANPSSKLRYDQEQEKLRLATIAYEESLKSHRTNAAVQYTVPVVFHILHTYGPENIPDANCIAALANMNNDYSATGPDVGTIDPNFASLYINSDIKFMLAHKDPLGNCTNGIVHHYNVNTNWNQAAPNYAYSGTGVGQWNPTKYLNIYVVNSICPSTSTCSSSGGIIVGYTYKPGTWSTGASQDAFVIRAGWVSSNYIDSRTLSHEIGHWFNLSHPWGNTNNPGVACGDDGVADTPITKGFFSICPGSPWSGCTPSGENVENIMDYSSCPKMFTTGQTNVMRAALASGTSGRNNIWTATNLGPTVTDVNNFSTCAPIADCYTTYGTATQIYTVCAGGTLTFIDVSYNAAVTARNWSGTGGVVVATPTAVSTGITFPTVGTQTVTLMAGNATGTTTTTRTVSVLSGVANYASTYQESFEGAGLPPYWSILNVTGGTTWQQYFGVAATGTNSYCMLNSTNPNGAIDILQTPSYDFASNPGATFTYKYAYRQQTSAYADQLKVQASSNCGGSWNDIYPMSASAMQSGSGGIGTTAFYATPGQFKTYTLTSHPAFSTFKTQPNVIIRFMFTEDPTTGFGNNIFLDDVNFNTPLGVNELTQSIHLILYPNPTSGSATIEFTLSDKSEVKYNVIDITGRKVEADKILNLSAGEHSVIVNESQKLKSGIYFVNLELDGQKMSRKLIVE